MKKYFILIALFITALAYNSQALAIFDDLPQWRIDELNRADDKARQDRWESFLAARNERLYDPNLGEAFERQAMNDRVETAAFYGHQKEHMRKQAYNPDGSIDQRRYDDYIKYRDTVQKAYDSELEFIKRNTIELQKDEDARIKRLRAEFEATENARVELSAFPKMLESAKKQISAEVQAFRNLQESLLFVENIFVARTTSQQFENGFTQKDPRVLRVKEATFKKFFAWQVEKALTSKSGTFSKADKKELRETAKEYVSSKNDFASVDAEIQSRRELSLLKTNDFATILTENSKGLPRQANREMLLQVLIEVANSVIGASKTEVNFIEKELSSIWAAGRDNKAAKTHSKFLEEGRKEFMTALKKSNIKLCSKVL